MPEPAKPLGLSMHFNSQLINRMFEMILVSFVGLFVVMNKICSGPYMIVMLHPGFTSVPHTADVFTLEFHWITAG